MTIDTDHTTTPLARLGLAAGLLVLVSACTSEAPTVTTSGPAVVPQSTGTTTTGSTTTGTSTTGTSTTGTTAVTTTTGTLPALTTGGLFGTSGSAAGGTTTTTPPLTTGTAGGSGVPVSTAGVEALLNGSSSQQATGYWECTGITDTSSSVIFAWYGDATGMVTIGGQSGSVNWSEAPDGLYMTIPGDPTSITFTGISYLSATEFQATLSVSGAGSAPLVCGLFDTNGYPVMTDGSQPINGGSTGSGSTGGGTLGGGTGTTSGSGILANDQLGSNGESYWYCLVSDGSELGVYFDSQGGGYYYDDDYPDGIDFAWSQSTSLAMQFSNGVDLTLSNPAFTAYNQFQVDTISAGNGQQLGSMSCDLYDFNDLPL